MRQLCFIVVFVLRAHATPPQIPFEYREGLLWVQATTPQAARPLNLLLDSGAGASVLDAATAESLRLKLGRPVNVRGVETTLTGHWLKLPSLTAGVIPLPTNYLAVNLQALAKSCQCPVDGLIGADFFRDRIVQIDFDTHTLRLLSAPPDCRNGEALPLQLRPCGMRVPISVDGGNSKWVRLDTGCVSSLQWVTASVRPEDCSRKAAIGLTEISVPQTETTIQIGSCRFEKIPTGIHDKPIFMGEAGLLGNGLLLRFASITIDAKSGRLILEPRGE